MAGLRRLAFDVPPFRWYMDGEVGPPQSLEDFTDTCRQALSRRNVDFTDDFNTLINAVYGQATAEKK